MAHGGDDGMVSVLGENLEATNPSVAPGGRGDEDELDPGVVVLPGMWPSAWKRRVMQRSF